MSTTTCCAERPEPRPSVTLAPGIVQHGDLITFVGKPKRKMFICAHGTFFRIMITLGFRCWDGVTRRGRFCQQLGDRIAPGSTADDVSVPVSDPATWPRGPQQ